MRCRVLSWQCVGWYSSGSIAVARDAASRGRASVAISSDTRFHDRGAWYDSIPSGEGLDEEARAGKSQAGFCEGEAHNGARSNLVTLSVPKGERNREHKADLNTGGVLSTRLPWRHQAPCPAWETALDAAEAIVSRQTLSRTTRIGGYAPRHRQGRPEGNCLVDGIGVCGSRGASYVITCIQK